MRPAAAAALAAASALAWFLKKGRQRQKGCQWKTQKRK
jgi:hypothetical protein